MVIDMNDEQLHTLADLQAFVTGTVTMDFTVTADERHEFIAHTVRRFGYARLKRADKAVVLRFLERVSGYSRQQLTRLVKRGCERRQLVKRYRDSRTSFARIYTGADVLLLAHTDTLHGTAIRPGDQETHGTGLRHLRRQPLPTPGDDLGGSPVQPASAPQLPATAPCLDQDSPRDRPYRQASRNYATNYSSKSKQNRDPDTATTMPRPNPRTPPSCANIWVTATSRNTLPHG